MREIAQKYIDSGLSLLTCKKDKSPLTNDTWKRKFDISEFENVPAIGIKCGKESGNLECLDLDNHDGKAKERLTEFIKLIKPIYEFHQLPIEITQGKGYHILWRCDFIEGNQKLASVPKQNEHKKWVPDCIFETRGEGGYFVAAPSPGYEIVKNNILDIPTITKDERNKIIEIAKSFNEFTQIIPNEYEQTEKPGDVYNSKSSSIEETKSILKKHGWKEDGKFGWIRPGKKEGISATFGKAAENCFYVFSANAFPFNENTGYSPFQVLGLLDYNGDFKACAKRLADDLDLKPLKKEYQKETKKEIKEITIDEKRDILSKSLIDLDIKIEKPPVILYISDTEGLQTIRKRLFTLGNFSTIIGKAKSRKTFALSMFTASLVKNGNLYNKFFGTLPENKRQVIYFDTEQGLYDSANVMKRIERLSGFKPDHFAGFNIREYTPNERCEIIEYALTMFNHVGFVAIDGIADLANAVNDEIEATRVVGLLMRWTKQYDCHICNVLHQNKNDNFATGWLGSSVMKKAEIIVSIAKEPKSKSNSKIACDFSRGIDFEDFNFSINHEGLPVLDEEIKEELPVDKWYDN